MTHIYLAVIILAVMVLFLIFVGLYHLFILRRLSLRISYLEGTLDMILQSQEHLNKLIVVYMNNV